MLYKGLFMPVLGVHNLTKTFPQDSGLSKNAKITMKNNITTSCF